MWLKILIVLLLSGVGACALFWITYGIIKLCGFCGDWEECKSLDAKLSFSQFIKFYELCPSRWYLYNTCIRRMDSREHRNIEVGFNSWLDFAKYRWWDKKREKEKELESKAKAEQEKMGKLLELIKADIRMVEKQSENEVSSAQKIMEKVIGIGDDEEPHKTEEDTGSDKEYYYKGHPIMIGDEVYAIVDANFATRRIHKCTIASFTDPKDSQFESAGCIILGVTTCGSPRLCYFFPSEDFGHRLFLTQHEAEQALKNLSTLYSPMERRIFLTGCEISDKD